MDSGDTRQLKASSRIQTQAWKSTTCPLAFCSAACNVKSPALPWPLATLPQLPGKALPCSPASSLLEHVKQAARAAPRLWPPLPGEQDTPHTPHLILSSTSQGRMAHVLVATRCGSELGWSRKRPLWLRAVTLLQGSQNNHRVQLAGPEQVSLGPNGWIVSLQPRDAPLESHPLTNTMPRGVAGGLPLPPGFRPLPGSTHSPKQGSGRSSAQAHLLDRKSVV